MNNVTVYDARQGIPEKDIDVGVMVFGKDKRLTSAVADLINAQLVNEGVNSSRHVMKGVGYSLPDETENKEIRDAYNNDQLDSVLDVIMAYPKMHRARVVVSNDTIGMGLTKSDYQENGSPEFGFRPAPMKNNPIPLVPPAPYDAPYNSSTSYGRGMMMSNLIDTTGQRLSNAIKEVVVDAVEAVSTFAGEDQKAITDTVLAALATNGCIKEGFQRGVNYALQHDACGSDIHEHIQKQIVASRVQKLADGRDVEIKFANNEQELRAAVPGISQEMVNTYLGIHSSGRVPVLHAQQPVVQEPVEVMIGNKLVKIRPIGQVLDNMIDLKIKAAQAALAAEKAEEAMEVAMDEFAEIINIIDGDGEEEDVDRPISNEVQALMFKDLVEKRAKETGLDKDVVALQFVKNQEKQGNPSGFNLDALKGVVEEMKAVRDSIPEISPDTKLLVSNDPENHEADKFTELPADSKAYVKLEKKLNDGSLSLADVDKHLKKGEKVVINGVTMARF